METGSHHCGPEKDFQVRDLIFRMVAENSTWGSPVFTANCSCSVSISRNERFPDETSAERPGANKTVACLSGEELKFTETTLNEFAPNSPSATGQFPLRRTAVGTSKPYLVSCSPFN
jgi:hypothetical protein